MQIKFEKKLVDVAAKTCKDEKCFYLFADKGSFSPGKGYTSYHKEISWVCGTRHLHGCPRIGICLDCRRIITPSASKDKCESCKGTNLEFDF